MLFVAEAYWDLEWELQQQGFDSCYDKRLYDRLVHEGAARCAAHLARTRLPAPPACGSLENHDEPRRGRRVAGERARRRGGGGDPARRHALAPGPVRGPAGPPARLPRTPPGRAPRTWRVRSTRGCSTRSRGTASASGAWSLLSTSGWPDNQSHENLVAWAWTGPDAGHVVIVNLGDAPAQARVALPWPELAPGVRRLEDLMSGAGFDRDGDELLDPGLFVDLPAVGVPRARGRPARPHDRPPGGATMWPWGSAPARTAPATPETTAVQGVEQVDVRSMPGPSPRMVWRSGLVLLAVVALGRLRSGSSSPDAGSALFTIIMAWFTSITMEPAVRRLERRMRRGTAVMLVMAGGRAVPDPVRARVRPVVPGPDRLPDPFAAGPRADVDRLGERHLLDVLLDRRPARALGLTPQNVAGYADDVLGRFRRADRLGRALVPAGLHRRLPDLLLRGRRPRLRMWIAQLFPRGGSGSSAPRGT